MLEALLALAFGFGTGFVGAIPPGPINVTVILYATEGRLREAATVAAGASVFDAAICAGILLGPGWLLERVVAQPWVKGILALVLVGYGLVVATLGRKARRPRAGGGGARNGRSVAVAAGVPFLLGAVQGASNPALLLNWTLFISFALGHGLLRADLPGALGFGVGVGLGAFAWFAVVIELVHRLRSHPIGAWIRKCMAVAGLLLVAFGLFFSWTALKELGLW